MEMDPRSDPKEMLSLFQEASVEFRLDLGQLSRDLITDYVASINPESMPKIILPGSNDLNINYPDDYDYRGILFGYESRKHGTGDLTTYETTHMIITPDYLVVGTTIFNSDRSTVLNEDDKWVYLEYSDDDIEDEKLAMAWIIYGHQAMLYLADATNLPAELVEEKNRVERFDRLRAI